MFIHSKFYSTKLGIWPFTRGGLSLRLIFRMIVFHEIVFLFTTMIKNSIFLTLFLCFVLTVLNSIFTVFLILTCLVLFQQVKVKCKSVWYSFNCIWLFEFKKKKWLQLNKQIHFEFVWQQVHLLLVCFYVPVYLLKMWSQCKALKPQGFNGLGFFLSL